MATPTLINLPPPPSDPVTPSDMGPGTPNSGTTSLSALSTTAIKDGHKGHAPPHHQHHHRSASQASNSSTNTLDAERADRISRLAGLERVATTRQNPNGAHPAHLHAPGVPSNLTPSGAAGASVLQPSPAGYFDPNSPLPGKERSTVGSASATGSAGGRTTWASGSDGAFDGDKMSEDGVSSVAGMSDEGNASLVGFGEAANQARAPVPAGTAGPMHGIERVRNIDGVAYDREGVDTAGRAQQPRMETPQSNEMQMDEDRVMQSPDMDRST